MVRTYIRKTERQLPSPTKIKKGLELLKNGYSLRKAAEESGVHYQCLNRIQKKKQIDKIESINDVPSEDLKLSHKSRSVFAEELEKSIADYCIELSLIGYGLSRQKVCELAYETAVENQKLKHDLKIPASWERNKKAGEDWFHGFMTRHPRLLVRTPEGCSLARAAAFNKTTVTTFFDKLHTCLQRHPSFADGSRVGNLDETANSTVQNTRKIVCPKGVKQVHQIKSAERGVTVTTCCIVTAQGFVIPPVMIFPRKKFVSSMMIGAYPGALGLANDKGYMTKETFVQVLKHVIKHVSATKEKPFLLLVDNVETHLSVEALTLAKDHGVTMLTFPPHCTHKLQPLDLSLFGPFKLYYDAAIESHLQQNPGQSITIYHVAGFVKTALMKSGTVQTIMAGFAKAGIMPFDRHIFPDSEFIMSSVTHRVDPASEIEVVGMVSLLPEDPQVLDPNSQVLDSNQNVIIEIIQADNSAGENLDSPTPLSPALDKPREETSPNSQADGNISSSSVSFISPKDFKGLPKAKEKAPNRKPRRKGKCCIATDTPEKREVEDRQRARDEKAKKTADNKRKREEKKRELEQPKKKKKKTVRQINLSDVENDDSDLADDVEPVMQSDTVDLSEAILEPPTEGDYVLVLFATKSNTYYVGKVIKNIDDDGDCDISFYRLSSRAKNSFVLPNVPDLCSVHINDIKKILPKPTIKAARTKRLQSHVEFDFNFEYFKMG